MTYTLVALVFGVILLGLSLKGIEKGLSHNSEITCSPHLLFWNALVTCAVGLLVVGVSLAPVMVMFLRR